MLSSESEDDDLASYFDHGSDSDLSDEDASQSQSQSYTIYKRGSEQGQNKIIICQRIKTNWLDFLISLLTQRISYKVKQAALRENRESQKILHFLSNIFQGMTVFATTIQQGERQQVDVLTRRSFCLRQTF